MTTRHVATRVSLLNLCGLPGVVLEIPTASSWPPASVSGVALPDFARREVRPNVNLPRNNPLPFFLQHRGAQAWGWHVSTPGASVWHGSRSVECRHVRGGDIDNLGGEQPTVTGKINVDGDTLVAARMHAVGPSSHSYTTWDCQPTLRKKRGRRSALAGGMSVYV